MIINSIYFDWKSFLDYNLSRVEKFLLSGTLTGEKDCVYYIGLDVNKLNDCVYVAKKYDLKYDLSKPGRSDASLEFVFKFPYQQTSNNIMQNMHFKNLEKYAIYIDKKFTYFDPQEFLKTDTYLKIKNMIDGDHLILKDYTVLDVYKLQLYGKYFGFSYDIENNLLKISKKAYCGDFVSYNKNDKNYLLQKSIDKLASRICFDILNNKNDFEYYMSQFLNGINETEFLSLVQPFLAQYNKSYEIIEREEDTYLGPIDCKYIRIMDNRMDLSSML